MSVQGRQQVGLKFGWALVKAIEDLGVSFVALDELARLNKANIDAALQRATPIFTPMASDLTRANQLENALTSLGKAWLEQQSSWWVRFLTAQLNEPQDDVRRRLKEVLSLAVHLAGKSP